MDGTINGLASYALAGLKDMCVWQPFEYAAVPGELHDRHEETQWRALELHALAADPSGRWPIRVVFVSFNDAEPVTWATVLTFETAPTAGEMREAIYAEARARELLNLSGGLLAYNETLDTLEAVALYATPQGLSLGSLPPPNGEFHRPRRHLHAARRLLRRCGQTTVPRRMRLAAAAH